MDEQYNRKKRKGNYKTTGLQTSDTETVDDKEKESNTDAVPPSVPSTPTDLKITDKVAESNEEIHDTKDTNELGECECSDMDLSNGTNESSDSPLFS